MKIYTGSPGGSKDKMDNMLKRDIGIMISSETNKSYKKFSCALDNGAFECFRRGFPFSEYRFMSMVEKSWNAGLSLDFIVCPDIVAGGMRSFDFSINWVEKLIPAKIALAVQDGMDFSIMHSYISDKFSHIFVGGTIKWKWETAKIWVELAHKFGMKCHIGRCGTIEKLRYAKLIGADSVDSTSFVRNDSWDIIDNLNEKQIEMNLF